MQRRRAIEIGVDELLSEVVHERTRLSRQRTIAGEDSVDRVRGNSCSDMITFNRPP
jgi:hypothetical protein